MYDEGKHSPIEADAKIHGALSFYSNHPIYIFIGRPAASRLVDVPSFNLCVI